MAILQEANAVFYHPLDDSTESLKAQVWTGAGTFGAAKVSNGLNGVVGNGLSAFGATSQFAGPSAGTNPNSVGVAKLSSTSVVVAYTAGALSTGGYSARAGTVSGADITWGAVKSLGMAPATGGQIRPLNSTGFVFAGANGSSLGTGNVVVGTVSGADITVGTILQWDSGIIATEIATGYRTLSIAVLNATKFVVTWLKQSLTAQLRGAVFTVSGTTVAKGTNAVFGDDLGGADFGSAARDAVALDSTTVAVAYRNDNSSNKGTVQIGTVSGTTLTWGAQNDFLSANISVNGIDIAALSSATIVVIYQDSSSSDDGNAKVGTVNGTTVTFGAEVTFHSGSAAHELRISAFDSTHFVVVYRDGGDSFRANAKVGTVSGTSLSFGLKVAMQPADATSDTNLAIAAFDASNFIVAWQDAGSGTGESSIGSRSGASAALTNSGSGLTDWGVEKEYFSSGAAAEPAVVGLDSSKIVIGYLASSEGKAKVATVSGTDITVGAEATFEASAVSTVRISALSATKVVVAFKLNSTTNGNAVIGTISGTDITFGTKKEMESALNATSMFVTALSSAKFVMGIRGRAKVGTVSGTDITFGAASDYGVFPNASANAGDRLDATKMVVVYTDNSDLNKAKAQVGTVTGTSILWGPAAVLTAGTGTLLDVATLSSTKFVVVFNDTAAGNIANSRVGTVLLGTAIALGTAVTYESAVPTPNAIVALGSTRVVVCYETAGVGKSKHGVVLGTDITWAASKTIAVSGFDTRVAVDSVGTAPVVAYDDTGDLSHGTAKIGVIPDVYPTVVGGEHVTFASWSRSPNMDPPSTTLPPTTTAP